MAWQMHEVLDMGTPLECSATVMEENSVSVGFIVIPWNTQPLLWKGIP